MGFCLLCGPSTELDCLIRSQQKINLFQFTSRPTFIEAFYATASIIAAKMLAQYSPHIFFQAFLPHVVCYPNVPLGKMLTNCVCTSAHLHAYLVGEVNYLQRVLVIYLTHLHQRAFRHLHLVSVLLTIRASSVC